ncbi:MAG: protein-signal peptide and transmembrane prediction [Anditalea sp.]
MINSFITYSSSACLILLAGFAFTGYREGQEDRQSRISDSQTLNLNLRSHKETEAGSDVWEVVQRKESWDPNQTAIIVTDMWDRHWCESATERVGELAPVMNEVIAEARRRGVMIIHAPSGTLDTYKDSPQRKRVADAAYHEAPTGFDLQQWCYLDPEQEAQLPIDDSDGGCDKPCANGEPCVEGEAWSSQIAAIEIHEEDFITDNGQEVYNLFMEHGVDNLILMGVHLNMCVLGRSFAIRQMTNLGKNVVLMRDMTDTMYNPEMPPYVSHFQGTELVIEHVEKYWAPTILSTDITGKPAFRFKEDKNAI